MNKRKRFVLEQALALFVEKGIQKTSITDIIEQANISKGTFYNYFLSKQDCIGQILEQVRYETYLLRTQMMIGKDLNDLDVLAEQITALGKLNKERGLTVLLEEILHSGDNELKNYVLIYRLQEIEWLGDRFNQIFQINNLTKAFEAATIYYGMQLNLTFIANLIHQNEADIPKVVKSNLRYMTEIIKILKQDEMTILDSQSLQDFLVSFRKVEWDVTNVFEKINELLNNELLTKPQYEMVCAIKEEMERKEKRLVVVEALLKRFIQECQHSEVLIEAREIASAVWSLVRQAK